MHTRTTVVDYHERTKHRFDRPARSAGYMDWANQPNPFRRYHGAAVTMLPLDGGTPSPTYHQLYEPESISPAERDARSVGLFLQYALGLSAWKEYAGSRWALRCNPSSGNLHPTEGYVCLPATPGISHRPGVCHYAPQDHALECRTELSKECFAALAHGWPVGTFFTALTSIHWREAWKYGERAYRYCQHDVGHALAALALSAATLGWSVHACSTLDDAALMRLLGIDRESDYGDAEQEEPDVLLAVVPGPAHAVPNAVSTEAIDRIAGGVWTGKANRLSPAHVEWEVIKTIAEACRKPMTSPPAVEAPSVDAAMPMGVARNASARTIIRQRRSAVAMDGRTSISRDTFYAMLCRTLPRYDRPPWQALGPPTAVDLALFVHRVDDLPAGLYLLVRQRERVDWLRQRMREDFTWRQPSGCPPGLSLFCLVEGDCRAAAARASCGQDIAGDSAFSLGMLAEFESNLEEQGAWFYRRLFWETGLIGQVLYLEAEAAGVRGTGIGCFFDDPVHELFGLRDRAVQSLYHFTIGGPVEDSRLTTHPPYDSARRNH